MESIGKYRLVRELGAGASGVVYLAEDTVIQRQVAIKTLAPLKVQDAEAEERLARFRREAQAAGRLSHPNIVAVYDYGELDELKYIVMEYVKGLTLADILDQGKRFQIGDAVRVGCKILAALEYSHRNGVVHRDIKPANVILDEQGEIKITDFGVARLESSTLTFHGTVLGTPAYMSPEQFLGAPVDQASDIYSTGVLIYQLLTGDKPFSGSMAVLMQKVLHTDIPRPSLINPMLPVEFDAVLSKATQKQPQDRYQSAAEFALALDQAWRAANGGARPLEEPLGPMAQLQLEDTERTRLRAPTVAERTGLGAPAAAPGGTVTSMPTPPPGRGGRWLLALGVLGLLGALGYVTQPYVEDLLTAPPPTTPPTAKTGDETSQTETGPALTGTAPETPSPTPPEVTTPPPGLPETVPLATETAAPEQPLTQPAPIQPTTEREPATPSGAVTTEVQEPAPALPAEPTVPQATVPDTPAPVVVEQPAPPGLVVTSNKGKTPSYQPGESLNLRIHVGVDAHVYCLYEQHDGALFKIFPNRFRPDPRVKAGVLLEIPDATMKFDFTLEKTGATEAVYCLASPMPLDDQAPSLAAAEDLIPLETGQGATLKRIFQEGLGSAVSRDGLSLRIQ